MLEITVPEREMFDNQTQEFIHIPETTLHLEHSLISLSKWEAKWEKPFLTESQHSPEEMADYVRCMTMDNRVDPVVYMGLTPSNMKAIQEYINAPHTATTIVDRSKQQPGRHKETITSELIYYWMISCDIPFECQKWHLNRLMMLIRVCSIKNTPAKKMSKEAMFAENNALNKARRKALGSRG